MYRIMQQLAEETARHTVSKRLQAMKDSGVRPGATDREEEGRSALAASRALHAAKAPPAAPKAPAAPKEAAPTDTEAPPAATEAPPRRISRIKDFIFGKKDPAEIEHKEKMAAYSGSLRQNTLDNETADRRADTRNGIQAAHIAAARNDQYASIGRTYDAAQKELKGIASARYNKEIEGNNFLVRGISKITGGQARSNARQNRFAEMGRRISGDYPENNREPAATENPAPDWAATQGPSAGSAKQSSKKNSSNRDAGTPTYQNPDQVDAPETDTRNNTDTETQSRWLQQRRVNAIDRAVRVIGGNVMRVVQALGSSANRLK